MVERELVRCIRTRVNCLEELAVVGTFGPKESPEGCRSIEPNLQVEKRELQRFRVLIQKEKEKLTGQSYSCCPSSGGSPYCLDEPLVFFVSV